MKNVIKNRSQRRGTFKKPQLRLNGFRSGHKSSKLLRKYVDECVTGNTHSGVWIMKNISNPIQVKGWDNEMRVWVHKLLNQDELIKELELELNEETTIKDGFPTYRPKNDKPQKLIQFNHLLIEGLKSELGIKNIGVGTHPYNTEGHCQSSSLNGRGSFFIRKYGNKLHLKSDEIQFTISNLKDGIELHNIEVTSIGNGVGTKFLNIVKLVSDVTDIPVYLVPLDFKGIMGGNGKLRKWYMKNGFKKTNTPFLSYEPTGELKMNLGDVPTDVLEKYQMVG